MYANDLLEEMRKDSSNKECFECKKANPQWAAIPFAVLLCLDCAGTHRGLGVHLSFVRSMPLDTWTQEQLATMRAGGNRQCLDFLRKYGVDKITNPTERYSTSAAVAYKAKIKALAQQKPWQDPHPSELAQKYPPIPTSKPNNAFNASRAAPPGVGGSTSNGFGNGNGGRNGYGSGSGYGGSGSGSGSGSYSEGFGNGGYGSGSGRSMSSVSSNPGRTGGGGGGGNNGFQGDDAWGLLASGWDALTTIASNATQTVYDAASNVDLEDVKANLNDYSQKGWDWTVNTYEMAKQAAGEWYTEDGSQPRQQRGGGGWDDGFSDPKSNNYGRSSYENDNYGLSRGGNNRGYEDDGFSQPNRGGGNGNRGGYEDDGFSQPNRGGGNGNRGGYNGGYEDDGFSQPNRGGGNGNRGGYDDGFSQPPRGGYDDDFSPNRGSNRGRYDDRLSQPAHGGYDDGFSQPNRGNGNRGGYGSDNQPNRGGNGGRGGYGSNGNAHDGDNSRTGNDNSWRGNSRGSGDDDHNNSQNYSRPGGWATPPPMAISENNAIPRGKDDWGW